MENICDVGAGRLVGTPGRALDKLGTRRAPSGVLRSFPRNSCSRRARSSAWRYWPPHCCPRVSALARVHSLARPGVPSLSAAVHSINPGRSLAEPSSRPYQLSHELPLQSRLARVRTPVALPRTSPRSLPPPRRARNTRRRRRTARTNVASSAGVRWRTSRSPLSLIHISEPTRP